jgi:hypothetical protein
MQPSPSADTVRAFRPNARRFIGVLRALSSGSAKTAGKQVASPPICRVGPHTTPAKRRMIKIRRSNPIPPLG